MALSYEKRHQGLFSGHGYSGGGAQVFTIFGNLVPANPEQADPSALTLGCKFQSDIAGNVIGVRFYKGSSNNGGLHQGFLWDIGGTLLNSVNFVGETASGWQEQLFAAPTPILALTTYVISYFAPQGFYAADNNYFTVGGHDNPPLHALSSPASGGNGVFDNSGIPAFPTNTFLATNYWVDLLFRV